ncbi:2-acylglycerol O-acyltransferase 3 isoform X2 [Elephas maximus indicus]|uniref:2-acylglycerol O-acyltransferase 3 isoform X2 n=1 Tax=Elephas maximus indicus TaxID=99487 RepID=UPI002116733D|nr:2-acylglycerol O-acyltransferase 3 isoform X2 [Elephas maximus indicus]
MPASASLLSQGLQVVAVLQWVFSFLGLAQVCMAVLLSLLVGLAWILAVLYLVWLYRDRDSPRTGGRRSAWVRNWAVWRHFCDYFPISLVKTAELDPSCTYLFSLHPHGILVVGAFGNFCTEATGFSRLFPGLWPHLLMLPCWFHLPFFRDYIMSGGEECGARPQDPQPQLSPPTSASSLPEILVPNFPTPPLKTQLWFPKLSPPPRFDLLRQGQCLLPVVSAWGWPGGGPGCRRAPGGAGGKTRRADLTDPESEGIHQAGVGTRGLPGAGLLFRRERTLPSDPQPAGFLAAGGPGSAAAAAARGPATLLRSLGPATALPYSGPHCRTEGKDFSLQFPGLGPSPMALAGLFSLPVYHDHLMSTGPPWYLCTPLGRMISSKLRFLLQAPGSTGPRSSSISSWALLLRPWPLLC